jgi:DNA-binding transcriptional LysR family regulator
MALGGIDLNLLLILEALLEECNVTRAALRLGMPQPTVSLALARLRRHYKDELLVRSGNGHVLTPLARSLLPSVQESMRQISDTFSVATGQANSDRKFTISLSDWSIIILCEKFLRRVHELAPGVNLQVGRFTPEMPESDTWVHQNDLLIAPTGFYEPGGLRQVICRDRFVCVLDPANPRLKDGQLSLADLKVMPHVVPVLPHAQADPVRTALDNLGITPPVAITTAGWLTLPFLVAGTDMVAVVPERLARRLSQAAGVAIAEPPFGTIELVQAAWWHPLRATDPAHAWLRTILAEILLEEDTEI